MDFVSDVYDQAVGPLLIEPEKNTESTQVRYDSEAEYKEWLKEAKVKFAKVIHKDINKIALLNEKEVKEIK